MVDAPQPVGERIVAFLTSWAGRVTVFVVCLVWTVPSIGLFISSFRPADEVRTSGWWTAVTNPDFTLDNYESVLESGPSGDMWQAFINSLTITVPSVVIPIAIAAFAAYAFAWMRFPGRQWLFITVVGLLVVPLHLTLVPILQAFTNGIEVFGVRVFPDLDLTGRFASVWLAHTAFGLPLAVYLLYNYIGSLPRDIFEAARIDGADHFTIFWRLVLPLSVPALAAYAIFQFLWVWNDFLVATVFIGTSPDVAPMTVRLAALIGTRGADNHLLTAGAFLTMILPVAVFFSLQRYFVRGLLAGSVKG
ncbi:MAG: carbohydrate ABC transporter permease [Acidimicrobiales bacterium]